MHAPQASPARHQPTQRRRHTTARGAALCTLAGALLAACAPPEAPRQRTTGPEARVFSENGPLGPNWLTEAGSRLNRSGFDGVTNTDIQPIQRPARPAGIDARP